MVRLPDEALKAAAEIKRFVQDQNGECYIEIDDLDGRPILEKIGSPGFLKALRALVYRTSGDYLLSSDVKDLAEYLEAHCDLKGEIRKLGVRTLKNEVGHIVIDTGHDPITVTKSGWFIKKAECALFKRFSSSKPLVNPVKDGDIKKILKFFNPRSITEEILFLTNLVFAFVADCPHPVVTFYGPQGASKSTIMKMFCEIVDPSVIVDISTASESDLQTAAAQKLVVCLDNISKMSKRFSDLLCKMVTGASYTKRILYTTDSLMTIAYSRVILMNGICLPQEYPDLIDRSILIPLERISAEDRRDENSLWEDFNSVKGEILGGCLDALSKAMELYPSMPKKFNTRMLDYAQWGCAIAVALGYSEEQFKEAIEANNRRLNEESLDSSPIVAILNYIFSYTSVEFLKGTSTHLLKEMKSKAEFAGVDTRALPISPRMFGKRLTEVKANLIEDGYEIELVRGRERIWTIKPPQYLREEFKQRTSTLQGISEVIVATSPTTKKPNFFN